MLGFVLAPLGQQVPGQYPNEINYAYGGAGAFLEPPDPQFNTRGEPGFYTDTPLGAAKGGLLTRLRTRRTIKAARAAGECSWHLPCEVNPCCDGYQGAQSRAMSGPAIPTDAELSRNYGYTPVQAGWINAKEGFFPGPWRPPGGWNPAGQYGPPVSLSGAGGYANPTTWAVIILGAVGGYWWYRRRRK